MAVKLRVTEQAAWQCWWWRLFVGATIAGLRILYPLDQDLICENSKRAAIKGFDSGKHIFVCMRFVDFNNCSSLNPTKTSLVSKLSRASRRKCENPFTLNSA